MLKNKRKQRRETEKNKVKRKWRIKEQKEKSEKMMREEKIKITDYSVKKAWAKLETTVRKTEENEKLNYKHTNKKNRRTY